MTGAAFMVGAGLLALAALVGVTAVAPHSKHRAKT